MKLPPKIVCLESYWNEQLFQNFSVKNRTLDLAVPADELQRRKAAWKPPVNMPTRGYAKLYMQHVLQAEHGCDFDFLRKA